MFAPHMRWLLLTVVVAGPVLAQGPSGAVRERFQKNLQGIGDANGNGRIDRDELRDFLLRDQARVLAMVTRSLGEPSGLELRVSSQEEYRDFVEGRLVDRLFNGLDRTPDGLEATELEAFEAKVRAGPWGDAYLELLPSPPPPRTAGTEVPYWGTKDAASVFDDIDAFFHLRKSFLDAKDTGLPANVSYVVYGSSDETLKAGKALRHAELRGSLALDLDSATQYGPLGETGWAVGFSPAMGMELDYSSDKADARNKVALRAAGRFTLASLEPATALLAAHTLWLSVDLLTNTEWADQSLGGTAQWSPDIPGLGVGQYLGTSQLAFRWRPYAAFVFARPIGSVLRDEDGNEALNVMLRATVEGLVGPLRLTGDVTHHFQTVRKADDTTLLTLSARLPLDEKDRVSLELVRTWGRRYPDFKLEQLTTLGLGLKL